MSNKFNMSVPELAALFSFVGNMQNTVLWLKTPANKQLYLGAEYEKIWERPCQQLYENPNSWYDSIYKDDEQQFIKSTLLRKSADSPSINEILFRIHTPGQKIKYIRDLAVKLYDNKGIIKTFAGIGQEISAAEWQQRITPNKASEDPHVHLLNDILTNIVDKELGVSAKNINKQNVENYFVESKEGIIKLSKREAQCLYYLIQGKSAKETANALFISDRTIECHLATLKTKLVCHSKIEIISKINLNSFLSQFN